MDSPGEPATPPAPTQSGKGSTVDGPPPATAPPAATTRGTGGPDIDESALRYFARQGDQRRLDAEIARLRALYPGWEPPANPAAPEVFTDTELDRMWQLFSEGQYAEVRSAIDGLSSPPTTWSV